MAKKDNKKNNIPEEEIITSSGSGIVQVDESARGRRGLGKHQQPQEEEIITSSGSGIAQVDESARGRRGLGKRQQPQEEVITSSGSGIAQVDESARGRRGLGKRQQHQEEVITSSGSGIAKIDRPRGRAALNNDKEEKVTGVVRKDGALPSEFILRGKTYKVIKLISDSTAEARVILVERDKKKYALKLYYANMGHGPDPEVLRMVKNDPDTVQLIKIYDFGVWVNPDDPNEECDYELMQYCEGGPLKPGSLHGDRDGLIDAVTMMVTAAVDCAAVGIIHRDIKPENFLWVDKEHTELVLSDFGFAVPCPDGESVRVEDHRTKLYTAPEFYLRAPGMPAKVDKSSDMYSVGISMLTLWSGEEVLMGRTETDLIEIKSREKLPYPEDMDADLLMLLKGLTRSRSDERWDDTTVLRWGQGELDEDERKFDNAGEIEITFDSSKGLVAHSRGELAEYMVQDQELAKKYLYSGRVQRWLEDAGINEVAMSVEEIVEKVYPKNKEAGLWSVIYLLSPATPYYFPGFDFKNIDEDDNQATTLHDMGVVLWNNIVVKEDEKFYDDMVRELSSPDSKIALYLDKEGKKDLFNKVKTEYKPKKSNELRIDRWETDQANKAKIWKLMYSLKPDLPWVMRESVAETVDELLKALHEECYVPENMKYEAFIDWLLPRDPVLAAKVKNVHGLQRDFDKYCDDVDEDDVVYALSPYMDYLYSSNPDDEDRVFTPEELAEELNGDIFFDFDSFMNDEDTMNVMAMDPYGSQKAIKYLSSKGKYDDKIRWIELCDPEEDFNAEKYGPYDNKYAAFKILKGLSGGKAPYYQFPDGTRVRSLEEMRKIDRNVLKEALDNGALAPWIATFYQEDPYADIKPQYSYEKLTVKFLDEIGAIDPRYPEYVKYRNAMKRIDRSVKKAKNGTTGSSFTKFFMLPFLALLFLFVAVMTITEGIPEYNPITGHYVGTAILFTIIAVVVMLCSDCGFFASVLGGALIGFGGAWLLSLGLEFLAPWLTWVYLAIVIGIGVFMFFKMKETLDPPYLDSDAPDMKDPGFGFRELEALHYAYKNEDATLADDAPNGKFTVEHYADRYSRAGKRQLGESIGWGVGFIGIAIALFFGLFFLSPAVGGEHSIGYEALNPGPKIMGLYSGLVDEKDKGSLSIDSVVGMRIDSAKMTIGKKSIILQGDVKRKGAEKFALTLTPALEADSASSLSGEYTLELNLKKKTCDGRFIPSNPDKNGDIVPLAIAFTTGEATAEPAAKPASTKKSTSTKKKSTKTTSSASSAATTVSEPVQEEPVREGSFKLEPVENVPEAAVPDKYKEELKKEESTEAKKERQPLKLPPSGH